MINKFQQGGIIAQIQQLPKEQQQQIMQAFSQWVQQRGLDINQLQKDPQTLEQALRQFMQEMQSQQTRAARHGAKLQYLKSLKNQCAEDEELYYYKKGGSVGCGCKKKEDGGEIKKAQNGAVAKFKNRKQDQASKDSIRINSTKGDDELEATRPGNYKPNPKHNPKDPNSRTHIWIPDRTKEPYNKTSKKEKGGKAEKDCGGSKMKLQKKGGEVCPKCGKVHAAGTGCAVAKFKKHRQGGSLNGIPFMQQGTPKGKFY